MTCLWILSRPYRWLDVLFNGMSAVNSNEWMPMTLKAESLDSHLSSLFSQENFSKGYANSSASNKTPIETKAPQREWPFNGAASEFTFGLETNHKKKFKLVIFHFGVASAIVNWGDNIFVLCFVFFIFFKHKNHRKRYLRRSHTKWPMTRRPGGQHIDNNLRCNCTEPTVRCRYILSYCEIVRNFSFCLCGISVVVVAVVVHVYYWMIILPNMSHE